MTITLLRRALTWTALTLFLIGIGQALVAVWTADAREWYIDGAGMNATLGMSFTNAGRWLATILLGSLALVCLAALAVDFASSRRAGTRGRTQAGREPQAVTYTPASTVLTGENPSRPALGRYEATIVGDDITKRVERSLPPDVSRDPSYGERPSEGMRSRSSTEILTSIEQIERRREIARFRPSVPELPSRPFDTVPLQSANRR